MRALVNYHTFGETHSRIKEELPYRFASSSRIVQRHVRIAIPNYWVFYPAQPELQALAARAIDMAAAQ
jgi:hypothetical protein